MKKEIATMKKRKDIKKLVKKNEKSEDLKFNKRKNQNEIDLWKEIRTNFKPLVNAYNKFSEKRRIEKQKKEERKLKEDEKQRVREDEALRLQQQEEERFNRQKKTIEEKKIRLQAQEKEKWEEKKIKDARNQRIKKEQIYRARLAKADEERIKQLKRVQETRDEEKRLRDARFLETESTFADKQMAVKEDKINLKREEQRLKEKEQKLKEEEKINLKEGRGAEDEKKEKILNGTVKWFNDAKGYGFIKREDKEKDIFVHLSDVQKSGLKHLKKGDKLTFEVNYSDKGLSAVNLQKTNNEDYHSHLKLVK